MKLSILMPVYNERTVVDRSISLVLSAPLPEYLSWLARKLRPHVGDAVLEVGAGIGNIAGRLMGRRVLYVAAEKDPLHLHALRNPGAFQRGIQSRQRSQFIDRSVISRM